MAGNPIDTQEFPRWRVEYLVRIYHYPSAAAEAVGILPASMARIARKYGLEFRRDSPQGLPELEFS